MGLSHHQLDHFRCRAVRTVAYCCRAAYLGGNYRPALEGTFLAFLNAGEQTIRPSNACSSLATPPPCFPNGASIDLDRVPNILCVPHQSGSLTLGACRLWSFNGCHLSNPWMVVSTLDLAIQLNNPSLAWQQAQLPSMPKFGL